MYPQTHFLFVLLLGLTFTKYGYLNWKLSLLAAFLSSVIDIDHYIEHIIHNKKDRFSLKKTWNDAIHYNKFYEWSFIHRWQGMLLVTLIVVILFIFNWTWALVIALAYYSHMILDYININYKAKHMVHIKEWKIFIDIPWYEIVFDLLLILGIIFLL
tara:strand:+ start:115504 stop:115974 length:471 start_codon:yes stop_codon:yes gene_type:complete